MKSMTKTPMPDDSLVLAAVLIREAKHIAIASHVSPDPDAIGSMVGLGLALESLGKKVALLCDDKIPKSLGFLIGAEKVNNKLPVGFTPDLFIGLDASDTERLGKVAVPLLEGDCPVLNIDHHITNTCFGSVNVVLPLSSTAEIIILLLDEIEVPLNLDIASSLFAGLVGDTQSFSTSNVTSESFMAGARLVAAGANASRITEAVLNSRSFNQLRVWEVGLEGVSLKKKVIWATLPYEKRKALKVDRVGTRGLSSFLLTVREANVSAVFFELEDGKVEISMRARPGHSVANIALSLGGGGHPAAAGCTIEGPLLEAISKVAQLLKQEVKRAAKDGA